MNHLPVDLNAEVLLNHSLGQHLLVKHYGPHHRNVSHDLAGFESSPDGNETTLHLGRSSLYHILPEYLFHSVDRFEGLEESRDKDAFSDEYARQQLEQERGCRFFAPIDALLLRLRLDVRHAIDRYTSSNVVLQDIIGDRLTESQHNNRFIRSLLSYLPHCSHIRGNKTLITLMLRKMLKDEGLGFEVSQETTSLHDDVPRYEYQLGGILDTTYAGNDYDNEKTVWKMHYWDSSQCNEHFLATVSSLDELRQFLQDWFLGIGQMLRFDIYDPDSPVVRLSDDECYNYLNYNIYL